MTTSTVRVASIHGGATPDETAAITAAVTALVEQQLAAASASAPAPSDDGRLSVWLEASRRAAQRGTLQRGPWRISGRIARRSRI